MGEGLICFVIIGQPRRRRSVIRIGGYHIWFPLWLYVCVLVCVFFCFLHISIPLFTQLPFFLLRSSPLRFFLLSLLLLSSFPLLFCFLLLFLGVVRWSWPVIKNRDEFYNYEFDWFSRAYLSLLFLLFTNKKCEIFSTLTHCKLPWRPVSTSLILKGAFTVSDGERTKRIR